LNVQYEFKPRWVLEVGYVGSSGINLADYNHNINTALIATPSHPVNGITTTTTTNVNSRVPYLGYQPAGLQGTTFDAVHRYNSLQATVRKQFSQGFSLQAAYTWSKNLTNLIGQGSANSNNAGDLNQQIGPAEFSRPNRFVAGYTWDLPLGHPAGVLSRLSEGWTLSGVTTAQSGTPLTITDTAGGTAYGTGSAGTTQGGVSRAQMCSGVSYGQIATSGDLKSRLGGNSGGDSYINKSAFCAPIVIGSDGTATDFGNSGVGILRGPGQNNWDLSLTKLTRIREKQSLQFRAEFFNAFNHAQFANPGVARNAAPTFGVITSTATNPRLIQFALKFLF
jgi:hypothetical protein